ncbi:MAG TPA: WcaF family extracellular polysaccharide biosynthesis acetyltransferase [Ferruginibacter sp.]|nr:WcaF family extracellular polysaccharide biosynthesis acetyltransferase [Ferruginibacter sp.]
MIQLKVNNAAYRTSITIGASVIKQGLWYFINVIFFKNPLNINSGSKIILLRLFGATIGKGVVIKPSVNIKYPWKLKIGNHSWIGEEVWIDNLAAVTIGDNVCISQGALLLCGNHNYKKQTFDLILGEIILEDGVWIGARSIVCPGVKCASHAVLAVLSVASSNLEPYTIYKGNPAIAVNTRDIS